MLIKITLFLFIALKCANSASILGVFPMAAKSHHILNSKLMIGLAEAGHDVTFISPYKTKNLPKNGTFNDIVLDGLADEFQRSLEDFDLFDTSLRNPVREIQKMAGIFMNNTNNTLNSPKVKQLLQSGKKFDAVIVEEHANGALKVFSYLFKCPLIVLSSIGQNQRVNLLVGNPHPVSYAPSIFMSDFSNELTLFNRAKNLIFTVVFDLMNKNVIRRSNEKLMHQAYPDAPPLNDLDASLVLLNSHVSMNTPLPTVPNMVEIGGHFVDPPKKLPKDLQDFLDSAKDGAIYFSMGSNLKSKDIPAEKKKAILSVLGKLKQKVLWKFEEELPGKPANIMIKSWLPQQDILAHPNIKLFITHGGLLSTIETIYHGVPILALPVFADQPMNAERAVQGGYAVMMPFHDSSFNEKFGSLVNEILENPKYRENAQRRSRLYHDRPMKPMETAVYWVEYVIRHQGAPHLRVAGFKMPWYKYYMVDVIGCLILLALIVLHSTRLLCRKLICKSNKSSKKLKKN